MVPDFLERIFWIQDQIKLKHWQEKSGFHHEQLGKFYNEIQESFDKLVECYLGDPTKKAIISLSLFRLANDVENSYIISEIRKFLETLKVDVEFNERGLQNLVDDLYNIAEQYSYLLNRE